MCGEAGAIGKLGVLLLKMAAVGKQNRTQITYRPGTENASRKPVLDQKRQITRVVEMCVSKNDHFEILRTRRKRFPPSMINAIFCPAAPSRNFELMRLPSGSRTGLPLDPRHIRIFDDRRG